MRKKTPADKTISEIQNPHFPNPPHTHHNSTTKNKKTQQTKAKAKAFFCSSDL
jgi:hypothetical protein